MSHVGNFYFPQFSNSLSPLCFTVFCPWPFLSPSLFVFPSRILIFLLSTDLLSCPSPGSSSRPIPYHSRPGNLNPNWLQNHLKYFLNNILPGLGPETIETWVLGWDSGIIVFVPHPSHVGLTHTRGWEQQLLAEPACWQGCGISDQLPTAPRWSSHLVYLYSLTRCWSASSSGNTCWLRSHLILTYK